MYMLVHKKYPKQLSGGNIRLIRMNHNVYGKMRNGI